MAVHDKGILDMQLLNLFSTKFCENEQPHDYNQCLLWHAHMSPYFSREEVLCNHLRRPPIISTPLGKKLAYIDEKCEHGGAKTCPKGDSCEKCHNEKEFMYHPLVYMTTECRNIRNQQCSNRTCAFYHSEAQRQEAAENLERLLQEIKETDLREKEHYIPSFSVDIESSNEFPSLRENVEPSKSQNAKRSYAETAKSSLESLSISSPPEKQISQSTLTSLNEDSELFSHRIDSEQNAMGLRSPISSPPFSSVSITSPPFSGVMTSPFTSSVPEPFSLSSPDPFSFSFPGSTEQPTNGFSLSSPPQSIFHSPPFRNSGDPFNDLYGSSSVLPPSMIPSDTIEVDNSLKFFRSKIISVSDAVGTIYEGVYSEYGKTNSVQVKEIDMSSFRGNRRDALFNHLRKLESLHHPNIIQSRQVLSNDGVYIVMNETNCSLMSFRERYPDYFIDPSGSITDLCKSFIIQLCSLLSYLGSVNMPHCNLEPSNIFVEEVGGDNRIVVGDFILEPNRYNRGESLYNIWIAPEELQPEIQSEMANLQGDMWRLGLLIFYLIVGSQANLNTFDKHPALENNQYYRSLIMLLLRKDPTTRLSPEKLLDHPVFWINIPSKILRFVSLSLTLNCNPNLDQMCLSYGATEWFGQRSWKAALPPDIYEIIPKYDSYEGTRVTDLLKVIIVTIRQIQTVSNDSQQSLHRAYHLLTAAGHPIIYFQELYPLLILRLWAVFFGYLQQTASKLAAFDQLLGF